MAKERTFLSALLARAVILAVFVAFAVAVPRAGVGCYNCARDPNGGPGASCYDGSHLDGWQGSSMCIPEDWGPYCYMGGDCCVGSGCRDPLPPIIVA